MNTAAVSETGRPESCLVRGALASIVAGVSGMLVIPFATGGRGWGLLTPALGGLAAAVAAWAIATSTGAAHVVVVPGSGDDFRSS